MTITSNKCWSHIAPFFPAVSGKLKVVQLKSQQ